MLAPQVGLDAEDVLLLGGRQRGIDGLVVVDVAQLAEVARVGEIEGRSGSHDHVVAMGCRLGYGHGSPCAPPHHGARL